MFNILIGNIDPSTIFFILSAAVLLPVQILLCFKVKNIFVRLLPVIIFSLPTIVFLVIGLSVTGWDALGYILLAILAGYMALACICGWIIWAIAKLIKKIKSLKKQVK